ncbi:MAG: hypothetical protein EBU90_05060 [Proteobacteria bacterium]|nr:hypothetical protein [Pseudomonadota bacterium]
MSGTKTGNKGFVNPTDGKVYTVDPVLNGEDGINSDPKTYDPGDMTVDKSVKDIGKKTKITLGTYLSKATKGEVDPYTNVPNKYSIDPSSSSTLPLSLTDNGYPTPPSPTENSEKFAGNLPSSFSQDFASLNQDGQKIKKGLSSVDVPDGHTLLSQAHGVSSPVSSYQNLAFSPQHRTSFVSFSDFKSPPKKLNVSLINLPNEYFKKPNEEAVIPDLLSLDLKKAVQKVSTLTNGVDLESPGAKNVYPVSVPVPEAFNFENLASLTTAEGKYPAPLTVPTGQNKDIFTENPGKSTSDTFAAATSKVDKITTLISKGKKPEIENSILLDGNRLFFKAISVDSNTKIVSLEGPLKNYTEEALKPQYRTSQFVPSNTDILSPGPFDPSLLDYSNTTFTKPGDSTNVNSLNIKKQLKDIFSIAGSLTTKNFYPVSVTALPSITSIKVSDSESAPLTTPNNQNASIFSNDLTSGYSYSKNWPLLWNVIPAESFKKGKSKGKDDAATGNNLVSKEQLDKQGSTIRVYQAWSTEPQYRKSFVNFSDFKTPPKTLDISLINLPNEFFKKPDEEAVVPGLLTLDLKTAVQKAATLTGGTDQESPGLKNKYSIIIKDFKLDDLFSITTNGYPSPLTIADSNEKFDNNLPSSFSERFSSVSSLLKKGKKETGIADGNDLLKNTITTDKFGFTKLNIVLQPYFEKVAQTNFFYPDISNSGLSKDTNQVSFLEKEINVLSPTPNFFPKINIVKTLGKYYGNPGDIIEKDPVTLAELRNKPAEITQQNQYAVSPPPSGIFGNFLTPISNPDTKLPIPLSDAGKGSFISRDLIKPLSKDPSVENFSKGKETPGSFEESAPGVPKVYNGNTLLAKGIPGSDAEAAKIAASGQVVGMQITPGIDPANPLYNYVGGRGSSILEIGNNRFLRGNRPASQFNVALKLSDGRAVSHLKMAQVGTGLLQRAAAEIPAWTADKFNPTGIEASIGSIIPSVAQLGILKVDNALLEAKDVLESLTGVSQSGDISQEEDSIPGSSLTSIAPLDGQSWGTFTTPDEMFGTPSVGFTILFFLLMLAVIVAASILGSPPKTAVDVQESKRKASRTPSGELVLGSYRLDQGSFIVENAMGIRATNNPFSRCLSVGLKAFFLGVSNANISDDDLALGVLGIGVAGLIGDGSKIGASLVVMRTIIRSGLVVAQRIEQILKSSPDPALAAAQIALSVFSLFKSSKLVGAINTFSQLGDVIIDRQEAIKDGVLASLTTDRSSVVPLPDSLDPGKANSTVIKNRLSYFDPKKGFIFNSELAWASKRAPSLYLIPTSILGLQNFSNTKPNGSSLQAFAGAAKLSLAGKDDKSYATKVYNSTIDGRISNDVRVLLENKLDAEYVPFYFHDVRTNEIVSFHAFLQSLGDNFSVSYESVEGFGRVEPVKIYKGTQRKIDFSFTIAATSKDDFDHMWFKINKLVTLAYPQYTSGRTLVGENFQFKAPFSQMIGASPLVRLRLGDLFHSNYSRFALARLFGATDGNMSIPKVDEPATAVDLTAGIWGGNDEQKKKAAKWAAALQYFDPGTSNDEGNATQHFIDKTVVIKQKCIEGEADLIAAGLTDAKQVVEARIATAVNGIYLVDIKFKKGAPAQSSSPGDVESAAVSEETGEFKQKRYTRQAFERLTDKSLQELVGGDAPVPDPEGALNALVDFMNPDKNVIVKSFESAGGKGLAGVIESMSFDWYSGTTWEVEPGSVAPKMCKVTVSFSPIHDITPGIDSKGYNRSPIYPVGNAMNGRT